MKVRYLVVAVLLVALGAFAVTAAIGRRSSDPGTLFAVALGKKEISPTTGKKGAGDKNGRAGFTAVIDGTQFCYGYAAKNVNGNPVAAHVHRGRPSRNGPIVIPSSGSFEVPASADPGAASGCETISAELARAIKRNPAKYYFNLHTSEFPSGAARGQLFGRRR